MFIGNMPFGQQHLKNKLLFGAKILNLRLKI